MVGRVIKLKHLVVAKKPEIANLQTTGLMVVVLKLFTYIRV